MFLKSRWHAFAMPALQAVLVSVFPTQGVRDWIQFNVTSLNRGQEAIGFEQIFRVAGTGQGGNGLNGPGYDYAYLIWNTGALPIDGFFFDVGVANTRAALSAFVANSPRRLDTFTARGGGDDGVFPNVAVGG